jgi:hypothetical protein
MPNSKLYRLFHLMFCLVAVGVALGVITRGGVWTVPL